MVDIKKLYNHSAREDNNMEACLRFATVTTGFVTDGPMCNCGRRDWLPKGDDIWKCSYCSRARKAKHIGIIVNWPKCNCGRRDWFVGQSGARCSYCDRFREAPNVQGYIVDGPKCNCGRTDWIVGENTYRCSYCDRSR